MLRRLPLAALLLYLALDCANPLMPGAVCFDADASVEAVGAARPLPRVALVDASVAPDVATRPAAALRPGRRPVTPSPTTAETAAPRARSRLHRPAPPASESD